MDFKNYVDTYYNRVELIKNLFDKKKLEISYDNLSTNEKTDIEMLYIKTLKGEVPGIFVFGYNFFVEEMEEQEFKKIMSSNALNMKIYRAYDFLGGRKKKIKISDIINNIKNGKKDSLEIHKILRRILILSYYLNWDLEKDVKDIEGDSFVKISTPYLVKLKQRYNFDVLTSVIENDEVMVFINSKGKLNAVFKKLNEFTKDDVENILFPTLSKVFNISNISSS